MTSECIEVNKKNKKQVSLLLLQDSSLMDDGDMEEDDLAPQDISRLRKHLKNLLVVSSYCKMGFGFQRFIQLFPVII